MYRTSHNVANAIHTKDTLDALITEYNEVHGKPPALFAFSEELFEKKLKAVCTRKGGKWYYKDVEIRTEGT